MNAQFAHVATLVPMDRVLVGKTSEASTQLTGPKLTEKKILVRKIIAIPALWAERFVDSSGGKEATMAVRMEYVTTKLPAPNMRGFFRPTVSRIKVMKL